MSKPLVEFVEVDGVTLRVATQQGNVGLPLLLFNGIGANLELCFPFMEALPEREIVIFDVPPASMPITTGVAALAMPGMLWCSATHKRR